MVKKTKDEGTQQRILAAARKVFMKKGMEGARMQDIADEAGINKAMLHYYFRDKDKLFESIFIEEAQKFFPEINMIFQADMPLFEKIEKFVAEYTDEMVANPYLPWFVFNELHRDPDTFMQKIWGDANMPRPAKLLEQVQRDVKKGVIKKTEPVHLLLNLLSMTIFPFVAKPMLLRNLKLTEAEFQNIVKERKKAVPKFIIDSIKK